MYVRVAYVIVVKWRKVILLFYTKLFLLDNIGSNITILIGSVRIK